MLNRNRFSLRTLSTPISSLEDCIMQIRIQVLYSMKIWIVWNSPTIIRVCKKVNPHSFKQVITFQRANTCFHVSKSGFGSSLDEWVIETDDFIYLLQVSSCFITVLGNILSISKLKKINNPFRIKFNYAYSYFNIFIL